MNSPKLEDDMWETNHWQQMEKSNLDDDNVSIYDISKVKPKLKH